MLVLDIPETELYDERKEEFIKVKQTELRLEHSLVSISKWESKWKKPFLAKEQKTEEEVLDYIRFMTLNQNVDPNVYYAIPVEGFRKINHYIEDTMSATTFSDTGMQTPSRDIITSELVYYMMFSYNIPMECQKWHFSRLMTLIRVFNVKMSKQKKMPKNEILSKNRSLNAARRAALHTKG
jgi:hypothetical protein